MPPANRCRPIVGTERDSNGSHPPEEDVDEQPAAAWYELAFQMVGGDGQRAAESALEHR